MKIYNYDAESKEFLSESEARENPLEKNKFLIPANATMGKPLVLKQGFAVCWDEELKKWIYVVDNRNKIYYLNHEKVNFNLGDKITSDMTLEQYTPEEVSDMEKAIVEQEVKQAQQKALSEITVTTQTGNTFDGGDVARADMLSALGAVETTEQILKALGGQDALDYIESHNLRSSFVIDPAFNITAIEWKLTSNDWLMTPIAEFKEAQALAIQEKGRILSAGVVKG